MATGRFKLVTLSISTSGPARLTFCGGEGKAASFFQHSQLIEFINKLLIVY